MKPTLRTCLLALLPLSLLACPEKPPPPPVAMPVPVQPVEPPPEAEKPPEPPRPPPKPPVVLNEPLAVDGGVPKEEPMPPWGKVEVGDYVVYDLETSRSDAVNVFRLTGGQLPAVNARVKLTAMEVDKTGVLVDVRFVPHGTNVTAPRWLESGLSLKMAPGAPRKGPATEGLLLVPPKTPFSMLEHAGKTWKCRYQRAEAASPDGTPSRRCVGSPDRALILGSGVVYAQNVKGSDGNPLTAVLIEAGKVKPEGKPGYLGFENGMPLVTRQTAPTGERLSFFKLSAEGGQVKTEETTHVRAATGQAAALTYDGANWLKPEVKKLSPELLEWVAALFTDEGVFNVLPEGGNPGASVVYGATRIDTTTVGVDVPASGDQPARTFRWLVPTRPTAIKTAPVWIRFGSVELSVYEGDKVLAKRRVVSFSK